jgi:hypothetical protein
MEVCLEYLELGLFPVPARGKSPCVSWKKYQHERPTVEQIEDWWTWWPDANVAIVCGSVSGNLIVVDIDRHGEADGFVSLAEAGIELPEAPTVRTGGGGIHVYYQAPEGVLIRNHGGGDLELPGVDIKGEGGCIVAPPSIHPETGLPYRWVEGKELL